MEPVDNPEPVIAPDDLRELVEAGFSNELIASYFGVEQRYVQACLVTYRLIGIRKRGPPRRAVPGQPTDLLIDREELRRLIETKTTNAEIAALFGVKPNEVQLCVKMCGLVGIRRRGGPYRSIPDTRLEDIKAMRLNLETLDSIGQKYNLTRERVRQILYSGTKDDREFHAALQDARAKRRARALAKKPIPHFRTTMLAWLHRAGYQYCFVCITVKCETDFSPSFQGRNGVLCRRCNTDRHMERYNDPDSNTRAYDAWYRKTHPEVQKRATTRYQEKHHDRLAAKQRERSKDPAYKTQRAKYVRDYYERCKQRAKTDPEYAEKMRIRRRQYAKRKRENRRKKDSE